MQHSYRITPLTSIHQPGLFSSVSLRRIAAEWRGGFSFMEPSWCFCSRFQPLSQHEPWEGESLGKSGREPDPHLKNGISNCFKSFPTKAKILIFAAQEHYQYPRSRAAIIINEPFFQTTGLDVQSACDLQAESDAVCCLSQETGDKKSGMIFILRDHRHDLFTSVLFQMTHAWNQESNVTHSMWYHTTL